MRRGGEKMKADYEALLAVLEERFRELADVLASYIENGDPAPWGEQLKEIADLYRRVVADSD